MSSGRIVFFGTSEICLPFLEKINSKHELLLVITQPDARGGRSRKTLIPAVKKFAVQHKIPLLQPASLKDATLISRLSGLHPDLGVVISYGKIIPRSIFSIPRFKTINLHFSLLPLYRGAAPVQRAILQGETESGITVFELSRRMDSGRIIAQERVPISPEDTSDTLFLRMVEASEPFLITTIDRILNHEIVKTRQDHTRATYAPPIKKEEGRINWQHNARQIYNQFRAFFKWPGTYFFMGDTRTNITRAGISSGTHDREPGDVLSLNQEVLEVGCGNGSVLEIYQFQPQCKKPMTPHCYSCGNPIPDRLN
jgi:methionyl-tRNA formyltransferase